MARDDRLGDDAREHGSGRGLWPYAVLLTIIVVALVSTVFLPFVNRSTLWFGLPSIAVWTVGWVLAIVPTLAALEFSGRYDEEDARYDAEDGEGRS